MLTTGGITKEPAGFVMSRTRVGLAYNLKPSNTVLRLSYARTLATPFNGNLIIATTGCNLEVIAALIPCVPTNSPAGFRNEFHAGLQQAFGKYLVVDGEYIWKYTHNAFDFSVLGNTPITFPIAWNNSKIPGFLLRASVPNFHGFTALVVMFSVAERYFPPQVGGLGVIVGQGGSVFRIDHEKNSITPRTCSIVEARAVGRIQLALRQQTGGRGRAGLRDGADI